MDSTLLDQIRHLCRDRAAYEHLKAILVQQERVHQLGWEKQYEKLISAQSSDTSSNDILSNIIAREKALAQLADAIQRSPSLELVLQIAVQVAQKLLLVDRVAIFRCHPDGHGEFATDAIASGLISLADMPERQLSLARHMIESTDLEHSAQTIDSIRTSSLSSHIISLLEQIGISSYAANKVYAGQEVWGTLVAFHGSAYHSWAESDRTSLSLIAAQIGIAISLANLRQQSQELTDDLETLRIELDNLQQTVVEIAESKTDTFIESEVTPITELTDQTITIFNEDVHAQEEQIVDQVVEPENFKLEFSQADQDVKEGELEEIVGDVEDPKDDPISQNGLPSLYLAQDTSTFLQEIEDANEDLNEDIDEDHTPVEILVKYENEDITPVEDLVKLGNEDHPTVEPSITFEKADISYVIMLDNLKVISGIESEPKENASEELVANIDSSSTEIAQSELNKIELSEPEKSELEDAEPEIIASQLFDTEETDFYVANSEELEPESIEIAELIEPPLVEPESEIISSKLVQQEDIETEVTKSEVEQSNDSEVGLGVTLDKNEDDEPAIEPEFMKTILEIAGNDRKATEFLLNVIDSYLEDAPHLVQVIDRALAVSDHARLLQSLNTLRSSSDYIGAVTLSYQCRQLESAVRANYVVLIYACLSRVAIEVQRATDALRIARSRYAL